MSKEIYIIRHGETDYNLLGMIQGSGINTSLNATGRRQAEMFYKAYHNAGFRRIYVSGLKRTQESVKGFLQDGIPYEHHQELNEISWGTHEGRVASTLDKEYFANIIREWKSGNTHVSVNGGESPDELGKKHEKIISTLKARIGQDDRVLICMHGRALRVFLCKILGLPLSEMDQFEHANLGLYILRLNDDGTCELVKKNCKEHLEELEVVNA